MNKEDSTIENLLSIGPSVRDALSDSQQRVLRAMLVAAYRCGIAEEAQAAYDRFKESK